MLVLAEQGQKCPKEGQPRQYIADTTPVEVPNTSYYRRLIREGSLKLAPPPAAKKAAKAEKGGTK